MPRNPDKRLISAQLAVDEYEIFKEFATSREWSDMKLAEVIIRAFIRADNKEQIIASGLKGR